MSDRIAEIRARLDGVGHYSVRLNHEGDEYDEHGVMAIEDNHHDLVCHAWSENADFIVHAPADIAWLLAEVGMWRERAERQNPIIEVRGDDGSVWVRIDGLKPATFGGAE